MANEFIKKKHENVEIFADLPDLNINGFTIPPDILQTQQRPDLVTVNRLEKIICLIELVICFETNFDAACARKRERYMQLKNDIEDIATSFHWR